MARVALIVVWVLFAGWVGWLAWQSYGHGRFPIVSRAQILVADIGVIAEVEKGPDGRPLPMVKVISVVWPANAPTDIVPADGAQGRKVEINNLPGAQGFHETGRYVLLLKGKGEGPYQLAGIPRSPLVDRSRDSKGEPVRFVYPETPEVLGQLREQPEPSVRAGG
ncbi:MAG: hypothetical protein ACJ8C4_13520 [Gemmataceae bacterium]